MKGIRVPGDRSRAICPACEDLRTVIWNYGLFVLDTGVKVEGVMLGHCEVCQHQVLVAQQSAPLIKEAKERHRRRMSVRLPRPLLDFVRMVVPLGPWLGRESPVSLLLRAMFRGARDPARQQELMTLFEQAKADPVLHQPSDQPVYLRLDDELVDTLSQFQRASRLPNLSQVVKRALVASQRDEKTQQRLALLAEVEDLAWQVWAKAGPAG